MARYPQISQSEVLDAQTTILTCRPCLYIVLFIFFDISIYQHYDSDDSWIDLVDQVNHSRLWIASYCKKTCL